MRKVTFFYADEYNYINRNIFLRDYDVVITDEFMSCAEPKLMQDFENKTGIKITKNIGFAFGGPVTPLLYIKGEISQFSQTLFVNHNWDPITVKWRSKSGRIYEMSDTDIDCNDIEFWLDDLDVALIHRQMFPKQELPFKLKNLGYELVVSRINMDCTIELQMKEEMFSGSDQIIKQIDSYIDGFNQKSEAKNRKYGVIHSWQATLEDQKLVYDIDLGSTGAYFFKNCCLFYPV